MLEELPNVKTNQTKVKVVRYSHILFCDRMLSLHTSRNGVLRLLQRWKYGKVHNLSTYERKTPLEHILLRPGMYIGQTVTTNTETWIYNSSVQKINKAMISYNPALLKIFDEILVNAADNKQRDSSMTKIDISITRTSGSDLTIIIQNDGKGVPMDMHPTENIYTPELIFGHLLTGSNFNDSESRLTGGSHGYGAKLTNIFSKRFEVDVFDASTGLNYIQSWSNNMSAVSTPTIIDESGSHPNSHTKITFQPDLKRFGLDLKSFGGDSEAHGALLDEVVQMFQRRALDLAACVAPIEVTFQYDKPGEVDSNTNDTLPKINSFKEYVQLFVQPPTESDPSNNNDSIGEHIAYAHVNKRWDVAIGQSNTGSFENMSFVNNVWTVRGGSHVTLVTAQVVKAIEQALEKKGINATGANIRNKMMVFINSKIENPAFEGQTKDLLNSKASAFGSTCKLSDAFLKEIVTKTGIVERIIEDLSNKETNKALSRVKPGRKHLLSVPKLEDAHAAGGARSLDCTLILTEGDSAKALAVAGLEVVGRETFGVMPLRGKVLNVRCATRSQALKNEEFINLCKALGLDFKKTYEKGLEEEGLRYGRVMIMCDQDTDGSHIKGLVINLFHHFWPALLNHEGYLQQFITPIVKTKSKTKKKDSRSFFSVPEFKEWLQARLPNTSDVNVEKEGGEAAAGGGGAGEAHGSNLSIKYYKGLGTNTAAEGREYFQALDKHRKNFQAIQAADHAAIDLAFNKDKAADRKIWLSTLHNAQTYLDPYTPSVSYEEFINKELILFSYADIQRSIPNVIDGLKPSQRKVLFGCIKKNLIQNEAKVVQIAGYIAEHTAYHHGEASLHSTIINMAQDYVGSNNVPLLVASGQFGTRAQGGKDFASPRYVFTRLSPITRLLFPEEDDSFLHYEEEDGQSVEPTFFAPVIPTLLLNGSHGIGTGWSTSVPPFHLPDVVDHVRHKLLGTTPSTPLAPHVVGFRGLIQPVLKTNPEDACSQYRTHGIIKRKSATVLTISELPYGVWTDDYKKFLLTLVEQGDVKEFKEFHTTGTVHFEVTATKAAIDQLVTKGLASEFRLTSSISLNNMHAFDRHGQIQKYTTPSDIIDAHFEVRHAAYTTRKAALERKFAAEQLRAANKSRFIANILRGELDIISQRSSGSGSGAAKVSAAMKTATIKEHLRQQGFSTEAAIQHVQDGTTPATNKARKDKSKNSDKDTNKDNYAYLLDLPIMSLTEEVSLQLQSKAQQAAEKLKATEALTVQDMWISDLDRISEAYEKIVRSKDRRI